MGGGLDHEDRAGIFCFHAYSLIATYGYWVGAYIVIIVRCGLEPEICTVLLVSGKTRLCLMELLICMAVMDGTGISVILVLRL